MSAVSTSADPLKDYLKTHLRQHKEAVVPFTAEADGGLAFGVLMNAQEGQQHLYFVSRSSVSTGKAATWRTWIIRPSGATRQQYATGGDLLAAALKGAIPEEEIEHLPASQGIRLFGLDGKDPELGRISAEAYFTRLPDREAAQEIDVDALAQQENERFLQHGLSDFKGQLHQEALHALRASEHFTWADYGFFALENERGERRRQAAEVYPLLATVMARRPSIKMAIDMQKPLNEALQKAFGLREDTTPILSKGVLKRLQGNDRPSGGIPPEKIVQTLCGLPADWVPQGPEEWDAFYDLVATVGTVLQDATRLSPEVIFGSCGGKWQDYRLRCAKSYSDTRPPEGTSEEGLQHFNKAIDWKALEKMPIADIPAAADRISGEISIPEGILQEDVADWIRRLYAPDCSRQALRNACLDVEDMVELFAYQVILPLAANETGESQVFLSDVQLEEALSTAAEVLFAAKAAPGIFEIGRHWHSQAEAIQEAVASIDRDEGECAEPAQVVEIAEDGWPPLTNVVQAPNGLWIVPLTDPRQLKDEGRKGRNADGSMGLHHCVGLYVSACQERGHHILSIRGNSPAGIPDRYSTAEIQPIQRGNTTLEVRQHRGYDNRMPPGPAQEAFEWYRQAVAAGQIPLNYDGLRTYQSQIGQGIDDVKRYCSYNWKKRANVYEAMKPWGRYVSKKYRKMGIDEFAQQPGVVAVKQSIAPSLARHFS